MDYTVFVVLAPLGAAALLRALWNVWEHQREPAACPLLATGLLVAGWLLFNTAEALATTPDVKLVWATATYIFIATVPMAWLVFALAHTNHMAWLGWQRLALLGVIPALTIVLAFTNEAHGLIWHTYTFYPVPAPALGPLPDAFLGIKVTHGAGYWPFVAYAYACLFISAALIIRDQLKSFTIYRRQSAWMVVAILSPLIVNLIYQAGLIPGMQKDFSPLAFAFGAGLFTVNIRRYRLLDLKPFARNLLIDRMHDGMLVLDGLNRIVDLNPAAAAIFALDGDAAIGQPLDAALRPEHHRLAGYLNGAWEEMVELCLPAGATPRHYELRKTPLTDARGRMSGHLLVLYDITQRKEQEEALRQANLRLESACEELDAFAHTVAHDLKNPVHGILGFGQILEEDYEVMPDHLRREAIQTIIQTAHKMQQIIDELLVLASVHRYPVTPQPVDMEAIVSEALERLRPEIEQRKAYVRVPDVWPAALGHAPWVEEVWMNYLSNALKYAGDEPHIELGSTPGDDGTVRFWVRDFGPGVPPGKQQELFVPFSRLGRHRTEGHGLGLSIVRRIMETLGGGFGMESSGIPGEGSTFYFTLPLAPVTPAGREPANAPTAMDF